MMFGIKITDPMPTRELARIERTPDYATDAVLNKDRWFWMSDIAMQDANELLLIALKDALERIAVLEAGESHV